MSSGMMEQLLNWCPKENKGKHCAMTRTLRSPLVESEKATVSNNPNFAVV